MKHLISSVFLMLLCLNTQAQQLISGTVKDSTGAVPGATVTLEHTTIATATDEKGHFTLKGMHAGDYHLVVIYTGYKKLTKNVKVQANETTETGVLQLQSNEHQMKELTIRGKLTNGSAADAIKQTRSSERLVTILSKETIAKMPDKNVAEAVQRVAGVKLERNKGEGNTVSLRGTPTDWTATLINGDRLPTASEDDASRTFEFLAFPANLVDYIFVTRTVTPDFEADNVGGVINFQTVGVPDKRVFKVNLGSGLNTYAGKPLYDMNFTYGNVTKNKKFSYTLSGSYYERNYGTDAMRMVYGSNYNHAVNRLELKDYFGSRKTAGVNAAVQYKPTDKLTIGVHGMHGRMDDDKWQYKTTYNWADGSGQRMRNIGTHGLLQRRLYGGDVTAEYKINDRLTVDAKAATYSSSFQYGPFPFSKGDPRNGYMNYQFISNDLLQYNDRVKTDFYGKTPTDPKGSTYDYKLLGADDPYGNGDNYNNIQPQLATTPGADQYHLEKIWSELNTTKEKDPIVTQLNINYRINDHWKIKAGGKYRYKEGSREISMYEWYLNTAGIVGLNMPIDNYALQDAPRTGAFLGAMGSAYQNKMLPFLTKDAMTGLVQNLGDSVTGRAMDKYNSDYNVWVGSKYKYNETVKAGYLMAEGTIGSRLRVVGGLRIEHTHFYEEADTLTSQSATYQPDSNTFIFYYLPKTQTVNRAYVAILPSLNMTYMLNDKSDLRAAISRTFHRPNFEETKPGFAVVNYEDLEYTFGNPNLKPTYSLNFDLAYQRYWGNKGIFTAGLYYKKITDHIFTRVQADADPVYGILYKYYENAGNSFVTGAESSIDKQFTFLKGWMSGFGINANFTYSYSRMHVPGRVASQAMTEQTPILFNIALYYEKGKVITRLGLNYNGAYVKELNLAAEKEGGLLHQDTDYDLFVGKMYSLDFQGAYQITKHFSAYVEANNLLNAPYKTYIGQEWRPKRIEYYGQRFQLGMKFDL